MKTAINFLSLFAMTLALIGCSSSSDQSSDTPIVMDEMPPMVDEGHSHPEHGPHGGELVELGKEAFHAELVHSAGGISMYILDGSATKAVPIPSEKLVVSLKHDGQVQSFDLPADPDANDPSGQSSRFTSADAKLDEWLDAGAEGAVVINIEDKSYTGNISHDHDHEGHSH